MASNGYLLNEMIYEVKIDDENKDVYIEIENELKANPFGHFLVYIEQGNNIIGYLYYSDIYERAEINQIEVEVFHRNCGIATKLLQNMIETVEKNITLEVKVTNNSAIHLYKKFGFCEMAIRKGYYQGIDGILMERKNNN
mgnify:CR=1 FL=1